MVCMDPTQLGLFCASMKMLHFQPNFNPNEFIHQLNLSFPDTSLQHRSEKRSKHTGVGAEVLRPNEAMAVGVLCAVLS